MSDDKDRMRLLLQEVGPLDEGICEVLPTGEETWAVRFEEVDVELELDPQSRRVMFYADICIPAPERREQIFQIALLQAMLWRETGGLRMGMCERDGPIALMIDMDSAPLTPKSLVAALCKMNVETLAWRRIFEPAQETATQPPQTGEQMTFSV